MVLPLHWRSYMLGGKLNFSNRHTSTCALVVPCIIPPTAGRRRPDKALGIRLVPWFPIILCLLNVTIPEYSISFDPRSRSADGKRTLEYIVVKQPTPSCLLHVSNFTHRAWGLTPLFTPRSNINLFYSFGLLHTTPHIYGTKSKF
jgi:hypothetical protein